MGFRAFLGAFARLEYGADAMCSAISAQWKIRPVLVLALLGLSAGCASFKFGQHPAMPGHGDPYETSSAPTPDFSSAERERIALVQPWVDSAAYDYELEPQLINAVIWVESRFATRATSPAGAQGLMQLMPPTASELARALGRSNASSYDPEFNVTAGAMYLRKMLDRYDGDVNKALAAYNAGPGNVDKWTKGGRSLPPRSIEYVTLVRDAKRRFEEHHDAILTQTDTMIAQAETSPEPAQAANPAPIRYVPDPPPPARSNPTPAPRRAPKSGPQPPPASKPAPAPKPTPAAKPSPRSAPRNDVGKGVLPSVLD